MVIIQNFKSRAWQSEVFPRQVDRNMWMRCDPEILGKQTISLSMEGWILFTSYQFCVILLDENASMQEGGPRPPQGILYLRREGWWWRKHESGIWPWLLADCGIDLHEKLFTPLLCSLKRARRALTWYLSSITDAIVYPNTSCLPGLPPPGNSFWKFQGCSKGEFSGNWCR